jgi:hypothetical protein
VLRLLRAYCLRDLEAYSSLLTEDFRFESLDPALRLGNPGGFAREDEIASASHLFFGRVRDDGTWQAPVREIRIRVERLIVQNDPAESSSFRHRRVVVEALKLEVNPIPGTWLVVHDGRDDFHVVRGDVALCAAGQRSDADHWYVRRWVEAPEALLVSPVIERRK